MLLDTLSPQALVMRGLVEGVTSEEYHAAPGVSKTGLDYLAKSPAHFQAYLAGVRTETEAMRFGRVFHRFILEPDLCKLAVAPVVDRRTRDGKQAWADFVAFSEGAEIVTATEFGMLEGMRNSLYAHPVASLYLKAPGRCELSRWAYGDASGELIKCRPDKLLDAGLIFDLKSTEDASPAGFARACAKFRYHVQAAYYPDILVLDDKRFPFLAVEKAPPYAVGVYLLSPEDVEYGRYLYQRDLMRIAECRSAREWPAYSQGIEEISLPKWATKSE